MKRFLLSLVMLFAAGTAAWSQSAATTSTAAPGAPTQPRMMGAGSLGITPDEMKELNIARQKAMAANPDLQKSTQELSQKMRDFEHKLNQAILAADPNVAPIVDRIEAATAMRPPISPPSTVPSPASPPTPNHP